MHPSVLIVDDSLTVRMDLKESFDAAGFRTTACATIEAARAALQQATFDVAILDVLLPDGDGLELLREIKTSPRTRNLPVLLLSTEDEVRDRVRGLQTGADDYVGKPYDSLQIIARARELRHSAARSPNAPIIVLIDDSPTFAAELREELEQEGYFVVVAATGEEGLNAVVTRGPAAVIVDQQLPGISGSDVIRKLRADAGLRRVPCLLLTASEDQADELRALDAGADSFCQKISGTPAILAKLAMLLRSASESAQLGVRSLLAPKRMLAVDDSATFLGDLCDHLREEGYDVVAARSGAEALELLESQPVDGILLDLMMPGMSGQETCREIKANAAWRDIPLIILTAMDERTGMVEGINAGADDYITKTGDFEILKARLRAQLRRKQFEDENREIREQLHKREMQALEVQALRELTEAKESLIASLEQKNAELARATQAAETLNKELESFSYSVSHDLRAPLRVIASFGRFLQEDCAGQLDEHAQGHLKQILAATERMNQLIEDMLSLSRVTRRELNRTKIDLSALARDIVANLRLQNPDRDVDVTIEDGLVLSGDRGMIRILLENLLGNAWKFTAKRPEAKIQVARCAENPEAFFVRDNGAGFDMRYAKKLFAVFQRLHRDDEFPGTGVGLATAARIVRRHGGKIWAESSPDAGATFFFSIT